MDRIFPFFAPDTAATEAAAPRKSGVLPRALAAVTQLLRRVRFIVAIAHEVWTEARAMAHAAHRRHPDA